MKNLLMCAVVAASLLPSLAMAQTPNTDQLQFFQTIETIFGAGDCNEITLMQQIQAIDGEKVWLTQHGQKWDDVVYYVAATAGHGRAKVAGYCASISAESLLSITALIELDEKSMSGN